ncbi:hypothetical protein BC936DRAFT_137974 [Jimgerdemannia flammicorona]|uniref:Uncharacterized protein n=1 Tax=Jimgerdemannia flammicorona TaxID=994334 RepID=A0A433DIN6_9FUNG|nr:hypothetical protein BC936DRAFT_137974 [Jimgerdemannia flammicorona]
MATKQKKPKDQPQQQTSSLSISRNKHWKYISSYHGPWLQLPLELLESLYIINNDTIHNNAHVIHPASVTPPHMPRADSPHQREGEHHRPPRHQPFNGAPPPPIDPIIFKNLITIRRLVDEAADLSVRAASGISGNPGGGGLLGNYSAGGRNMTMSAIRQHRMRELAVNKLALAYRIDEIATAVVTMQSASAVDEVAAKVLKKNADHLEALYVNFFHEKIPSRLAFIVPPIYIAPAAAFI